MQRSQAKYLPTKTSQHANRKTFQDPDSFSRSKLWKKTMSWYWSMVVTGYTWRNHPTISKMETSKKSAFLNFTAPIKTRGKKLDWWLTLKIICFCQSRSHCQDKTHQTRIFISGVKINTAPLRPVPIRLSIMKSRRIMPSLK